MMMPRRVHRRWLLLRRVSRAVWILLAVFAALVAVRLTIDGRTNARISNDIARLRAEADALELKNKDLQVLVEHFSSDDFAEEEGRTKLGLRKPGEEVVIFEVAPVSSTSDGATPPDGPRGPVGRWLRYFFGT